MIEYDPHDWYAHLLDVRGSMVREILGRVSACVIWSAVVVVLHWRFPWLSIPSILHTLTGLALGLLLVFRTNASYDRFWEARRLWGSIINESRNLGRAAKVLLAGDTELRRQVIRWAQVLPFAIAARLRDVSDLGPPAKRLPPDEVQAVVKSAHPPTAVAARLMALLAEARDRGLINAYDFVYIDQNVQQMIDYCGGCERIHSTPIPFAYMVHLRRALILYCFTLPFALVNDFGWGTVLDTLMVAYIFFGIEEIGVEIEDPFGQDDNDLPLNVYCDGIDRVLEDLVQESPAATVSVDVDATPSAPAPAVNVPIPLDE